MTGWARAAVAVLSLALVAFAFPSAGCDGEGTGGAENGDLPASTTSVLPTTTTASTLTEWVPGEEVQTVLAAVAAQYPGAILYAPSSIPAGAVVAEGWWPVASSEEPPPRAEWEDNPRVLPGDPRPEVRLVLRTGDAWIELLEGMQGDLGNLPGERTVEVAGGEASVHTMLGGTVVQWSRGSSWFAVFGRGLAETDVIRLAEAMEPVSDGIPESSGAPE